MKKQTIVLQIIVLLLVLGLAITGASIAHFNSPKTTKDNTTTVENTTANYTKNFSEDFYNDYEEDNETIDFSPGGNAVRKWEKENRYVDDEDNSYTVYVTDTGSKYHALGCQYLDKSCYEIDIDKAIEQGYEPCSKCNP